MLLHAETEKTFLLISKFCIAIRESELSVQTILHTLYKLCICTFYRYEVILSYLQLGIFFVFHSLSFFQNWIVYLLRVAYDGKFMVHNFLENDLAFENISRVRQHYSKLRERMEKTFVASVDIGDNLVKC